MPACGAEPGRPPLLADPIRSLEPVHHVRYTAPCNLECFYCYERPHPRRARAGALERVADELRLARAAGYRVAIFGAGELLLLRGWPQLLRLARELGFEQVWMLSNLLALTRARLDRLEREGLSGVVATLFALDDPGARMVAGGEAIFTRQREGMARISDRGGLGLAVHLMLTRPLVAALGRECSSIRSQLGLQLESLMLSAIEPVSEGVAGHAAYTHALDLPWPELLAGADQAGLFVVTQNLPACLLGEHAHRSLQLRRRVGRILRGWPEDPALAARVDRGESLYRRLAPSGPCRGCKLVAVCHRFFEPAVTRPDPGASCAEVVERLLREESISASAGELCRRLDQLESRPEPAAGPAGPAGGDRKRLG